MCGNFQQKKPTELFYTANTDVSNIRVVLAEAAQNPNCGTGSLDVATAFLNAPMPAEEKETVYVKPPTLLEQFRLIKPGILLETNKSNLWIEDSPTVVG